MVNNAMNWADNGQLLVRCNKSLTFVEVSDYSRAHVHPSHDQ